MYCLLYMYTHVCNYVHISGILLCAGDYYSYVICLQVTPYLAQYFPVTFSAIQPYVSMCIYSYIATHIYSIIIYFVAIYVAMHHYSSLYTIIAVCFSSLASYLSISLILYNGLISIQVCINNSSTVWLHWFFLLILKAKILASHSRQ